MEQKARAFATYTAYVILLLAVLLLRQLPELIAGGLLLFNSAQHLQLLWQEKWDKTHYASVGLLMLVAYFTLLFLLTRQTFVSNALGAILVAAAAILLLLELVDGWRTYNMLDRMVLERQKRKPSA